MSRRRFLRQVAAGAVVGVAVGSTAGSDTSGAPTQSSPTSRQTRSAVQLPEGLKAGVAKTEITPPVGMRMAGFAGRVFPSLAVHDPLWARALVLDDGKRRAGLLALDLIAVSDRIVAQVREGASSSAGIAEGGLLIAGTHTHSGPGRPGDDATEAERGYWEALPDRLVDLLNQAASALVPARLGAVSGWSAIGINRRESVPEGGGVVLGRNHFGKFDTEVGLLRVDRKDGSPLAGLMNYACHPVCLMEDNYLISADYPGYARHFFEQMVPGAMGIFFNGACGNVNPREAAVGHGYASGGSFSIAARAGRDLAREVARIWSQAELTEEAPVRVASRRIALPTNRRRAVAAAEEALKEDERASAGPGEERSPYMTWYSPPNPERTRRRLAELKKQGDAPVECEVQVIQVGPVTLMGWPGEVFCDLGMQIKDSSPFRPTYVIGYANGSIGYVPTAESFQEGGYEPRSAAHLADNAGLVLLEESSRLLNRLKT